MKTKSITFTEPQNSKLVSPRRYASVDKMKKTMTGGYEDCDYVLDYTISLWSDNIACYGAFLDRFIMNLQSIGYNTSISRKKILYGPTNPYPEVEEAFEGALQIGGCSLNGSFSYLNIETDCNGLGGGDVIIIPTNPNPNPNPTGPINVFINEEWDMTSCHLDIAYSMQGAVTTTDFNEQTVMLEGNKREIRYTWACFTAASTLWRFVSHDLAKHKKINGEWEFQAMEHHNVVLTGNNFGQIMTYYDEFKPKTEIIPGGKNATVELRFAINSTYYCDGIPFERTFVKDQLVRKVFPIKD